MKAIILDYRRGRHAQTPNQAILEVEGTDSAEKAKKLEGKPVAWKSSGNRLIKGKITAPHGRKGRVRARFERGLPGQAIGSAVEVK